MKINLHKLRGSNVLTYGDFDIDLDNCTVSQLVGKNGSGKSSLPVILEEILYNNNSRGIKKAKLVNRRTKETSWWGEILFSIGTDSYSVKKTVKSSAKLELTKNGEDISGHTATQTYAIIKGILGDLDFKTFSKLVYQSIDSSLDFLKTTDANRKKFLTSFLGLEKYGEIEKDLKERTKVVDSELSQLEKEQSRLKSWISANSKMQLEDEDITLPKVPDNTRRIEELENELDAIKAENIKAELHNSSVEESKQRLDLYYLESEKLKKLVEQEPKKPIGTYNPKELSELNKRAISLASEMAAAKKSYQTYRDEASNTKCSMCGHSIDTSKAEELREGYKLEYLDIRSRRNTIVEAYNEVLEINKVFEAYEEWEEKVKFQKAKLEGFGDVNKLAEGLLKPVIDTTNIVENIKALRSETRLAEKDLEKANIKLAEAKKNNELYRKREKELEIYKEELEASKTSIKLLKEEQGNLAILLKAFSNKGIVAYKIESSIKIFEELINKYLTDFTDGKFALVFKLSGSKLQVVIYDEGEETDMSSLSSGEQSKVNISTLLAVRSLMSATSKINLNTLFLDEVVSVLDQEAMDTLINILLREHELNTFVVSHGYTHPLTKTVSIVRDGATSKITQ